VNQNSNTKKKRNLSAVSEPIKMQWKRIMMFKFEDVRRDYLVLNIIRLMDYILREELPSLNSLDNDRSNDPQRITYRVIPTGITDGFIEFVDGAFTICEANGANRNNRTLQNWFLNQGENGNNYNNIRELYARTMAFWSVATLLLGVGDRHSCNIMVKPNGALFHIDYGFILGQDPKPFVPYMRITKDMVEVMGGKDDDPRSYYGRFVTYCERIYLVLRHHAHLIFDMCRVLFFWDPPLEGKTPDMNYAADVMRQLHFRFNTKASSLQAQSTLRTWIDESYNNPMLDIIDQARKYRERSLWEIMFGAQIPPVSERKRPGQLEKS